VWLLCDTVIPYDKWSHERIKGLLTYMRYTNRRVLYFTLLTGKATCRCGTVAVQCTYLFFFGLPFSGPENSSPHSNYVPLMFNAVLRLLHERI